MERRTFVKSLLTLPIISFGACLNSKIKPQMILNAIVEWNNRLRSLIILRGYDPVYTSRIFAYYSKALSFAYSQMNDKDDYYGLLILINSLSSKYISCCFPEFVDYKMELEQLKLHKKTFDSTAFDLGLTSVEYTFKQRYGDGSENNSKLYLKQGRGIWHTTEDRPPVRPFWGEVKPFEINDMNEFMYFSPPTIESDLFIKSLENAKIQSKELTPNEQRQVLKWSDSAGSYTPIGHWNEIFCNFLLKEPEVSIDSALKYFYMMNAAMFDAGIICWKYKYKYLYARPSQFDKSIKTWLKIPNFPSYVSGHSVFSSAASMVLKDLFSKYEDELIQMAKEASYSRVLAGIHFDFDCQDGFEIGKLVGGKVINKYK